MATLGEAANVSWRVLKKLRDTQRIRLSKAAYTPASDRDSDQQSEIDHARELDEKLRRRANGVNSLHCGRVHGHVVFEGQPRGQKRGK